MTKFLRPWDATDWLASQIAEQARRQNVSLSEVERKMLYFSETVETLQDMPEVFEEFEREYQEAEYEEKVASLIRQAYKRVCEEAPEQYETWWSAIRASSKEDRYIGVLIQRAHVRRRGDSLRLFLTGLAIVLLLLVAVAFDAFLENRLGNTPLGKYLPTRENSSFYIGAALAIVAMGYGVVRWKLRAEKTATWLNKVIERFFGTAAHDD